MEQAIEFATRHREGLRRFFPGRALARTLCLGLALLADQAMAGYTYRMTGAECTDSNHPEKYYPDVFNPYSGDFGIGGAGPKLCAKHTFVEVRLRDGYGPGTDLGYFPNSGRTNLVESLSYNDGARSFFLTFGPEAPIWIGGSLPEKMRPSNFGIGTNGGGFSTSTDGTWRLNAEGAAGPDGICAIGSTEGPNLNGGGCITASWSYDAVGTYKGWRRVPEPASLGMLALAFSIMGGLGSRKRRS